MNVFSFNGFIVTRRKVRKHFIVWYTNAIKYNLTYTSFESKCSFIKKYSKNIFSSIYFWFWRTFLISNCYTNISFSGAKICDWNIWIGIEPMSFNCSTENRSLELACKVPWVWLPQVKIQLKCHFSFSMTSRLHVNLDNNGRIDCF